MSYASFRRGAEVRQVWQQPSCGVVDRRRAGDGFGCLLLADVLAGVAWVFDLRTPTPQGRECIEGSAELRTDDVLGGDVVTW